MNPDEQAKLQNQLLLQESQQLHDNIQRNLNELHKIVGIGFPVLTGAFALALKGPLSPDIDKGLVYALFSILAALIIVGFNNVWIQLGTFTRYKYAEVLPRLYELTGRVGDNWGRYTARGGTTRAMIGVIIVQAILLPMAVAAIYRVWTDYRLSEFAIPAYFALAAAAVTTVASWFEAAETVRVIRGDRRPRS